MPIGGRAMPVLDDYIPEGALTPEAEVHEVELPAAARALTRLSRVDYTDATLLQTSLGRERSAEQWARATLEDAPASTRAVLRRGWLALGLALGTPDDPRRVLGWTIRSSSHDHALLV